MLGWLPWWRNVFSTDKPCLPCGPMNWRATTPAPELSITPNNAELCHRKRCYSFFDDLSWSCRREREEREIHHLWFRLLSSRRLAISIQYYWFVTHEQRFPTSALCEMLTLGPSRIILNIVTNPLLQGKVGARRRWWNRCFRSVSWESDSTIECNWITIGKIQQPLRFCY